MPPLIPDLETDGEKTLRHKRDLLILMRALVSHLSLGDYRNATSVLVDLEHCSASLRRHLLRQGGDQ